VQIYEKKCTFATIPEEKLQFNAFSYQHLALDGVGLAVAKDEDQSS